MLEVKDLRVAAGSTPIIEGINFSVNQGEVLTLFGPNGSGKSTLLKAILGIGGYEVKKGSIVFKGRPLNGLAVEERVKLGLGMMYQHPPKIRGVKLGQIARFLCPDEKKIQDLAEKLALKDHLDRDLNLDFSGGEMKRAELFQLILQSADFLLLDEPESGVDIENISLMGEVLNTYLRSQDKSALIITHTGYILDYIESKRGCVMLEGKFWCAGRPKEIFQSIRDSGYQRCKDCLWHKET